MAFSRTCPIALLPSGTDSRAAMKLAAVRRLEPPPHATPQITNALRRPHRERRGCSSPTSATDLRHVHLLPIARLPECSVHFRSPNPTNGVASAGTPGRFAFDDAIRASVDSSLTRSAIWRSRAPLNPGGLRYRRALEGAPPVPRRFLPRARSARRPLTPPVATCSGSFDPPPAARTAFPQSPAKGSASVRSEAPSLDECPLDAPPPFRETTNLEREPATGPGALPPFNPASDALSPPRSEGRWLDRGRYRALFTPGRSWPHAARRLLQSKRSASTTCGPRNPVTPIGRSTFAELLILRNRSSFRLGHRRFYTSMIQSKGSREFTGQGPLIALQSMIALPASSATIAHRGGFAPTRSARTPHVAPPASTTIGAP